jgi:hypothetical protein
MSLIRKTKGGDITSKTIEEMIKEGENDAMIEISPH